MCLDDVPFIIQCKLSRQHCSNKKLWILVLWVYRAYSIASLAKCLNSTLDEDPYRERSGSEYAKCHYMWQCVSSYRLTNVVTVLCRWTMQWCAYWEMLWVTRLRRCSQVWHRRYRRETIRSNTPIRLFPTCLQPFYTGAYIHIRLLKSLTYRYIG